MNSTQVLTDAEFPDWHGHMECKVLFVGMFYSSNHLNYTKYPNHPNNTKASATHDRFSPDPDPNLIFSIRFTKPLYW